MKFQINDELRMTPAEYESTRDWVDSSKLHKESPVKTGIRKLISVAAMNGNLLIKVPTNQTNNS